MEKRLLLAIVISIAIMLVYPLFLAKISPPPIENNIQGETLQPLEKAVVKAPAPPLVSQDSSRQLPKDAVVIPVSSPRYELVFSNIGGAIQKISVKDTKRLENDLVENAILDAGVLSIEGDGPLRGLSSQPFIFQHDTNTLYTEKDGMRVEKTIRFLKDQYGLRVSIAITNVSQLQEPVSFQITTASNISRRERYESRYIEAGTCQSDDKIKRLSGGKLKKDNQLREQGIKWLYLKNKYYSIICKPEFNTSGVFTKYAAKQAIVGFMVDDRAIRPGETRRYEFKYYIGPTEVRELEKVDKSFGRVLNFGIFTGIGMILLSVLKFFYAIFHNYGVAILLLTFCISMLMFPLTFKSMSSMRKLQELQPKIEKIRTEHKDNPQKLNKEIMELYRRHKANPMGGCMPMLLQTPIFIALYQTLMRSVELKGARFLWIKDLSMPDAAFHLPFSLPFLGSAINILPILMIGAMIIQQKMSQFKTAGSQTDQQKMMSSIMPVMFGFIFYNLPSGLVLYWLTNTLLTSTLQFSILKKA